MMNDEAIQLVMPGITGVVKPVSQCLTKFEPVPYSDIVSRAYIMVERGDSREDND